MRGLCDPHERATRQHDAGSHDLVQGVLVPVDGFHHLLENEVEDLVRFLGVAVVEQLHRAVRAAKRTVTCLRSPSTALFEVTIFSATWLGVLGLGRSYIPIHAFHFTFYYQQPQW
jgi:hypothetical protein